MSQALATALTCALHRQHKAVHLGLAHKSRGLTPAAASCLHPKLNTNPARRTAATAGSPLSAGAADPRRTFQKGGSEHQSPGAAGTRANRNPVFSCPPSPPVVRPAARRRCDRCRRAGKQCVWRSCLCIHLQNETRNCIQVSD